MLLVDLPSWDPPTTTRKRACQAGISLVEMMVTLSIIAVATSLVLLTVPMRPQFKQEASLLQEALEQIASRALVSGQPMGLVIEGNTYAPAVWQSGTWRVLGSRQLSGDIGLLIDGKPPVTREDDDPVVPAVIFDPLGHTQPAAIELVRNDVLTSLTLRADGKVEVEVR